MHEMHSGARAQKRHGRGRRLFLHIKTAFVWHKMFKKFNTRATHREPEREERPKNRPR